MASKRYKILLTGSFILLLIFSLNHMSYYFRSKKIAERKAEGDKVLVRAQNGSTGHNTIEIDESSLTSRKDETMLHFSSLGKWKFFQDGKQPCPAEIKSLSGSEAKIIGFMYPLQAGSKIKVFCLMRSTQTCCYGLRPQYNQYVFVEMKNPVKFERFSPVVVQGTFFVDPKPAEGYIYRMEADTAAAIAGDEPESDPVEQAKKAGLPLFDISLLGKLKGSVESAKRPEIPPELKKLDGKKVVVAGYQDGRIEGEVPGVIVGKSWWDGVSKGTPPNIFNAVMVHPRDKREVPPLWKQEVVFTGTLRITENPGHYAEEGLAKLFDATRGIPGSGKLQVITDYGPLIPAFYEIIIVCTFFIWGFLIYGKK